MQRNRRILDTAQATTESRSFRDSRMPLQSLATQMPMANLKAIVKDYSKHPALMGYFITDEPGASAFSGLAKSSAEIEKLDPDHLAYINLFPNYATSDLNTTPSQLAPIPTTAIWISYSDGQAGCCELGSLPFHDIR